MAGGTSIWGVDLGKCALKAVKLRLAGEGKVEILAYDVIEHAKVLTQPDADKEALISAALEKFLSKNDITNSPVVVSVPGQHTLARFSKLPPVEAKKIPDIVRYEAAQQIPFDMDEVIWDYQIFQKEDSPEVEAGIFAMKRELIREYLRHFENVGIEPIIVQSSPLALYNAAVFDGILGADTTVLLDIGTENTDLIVATPYSLWTRTIPLGGNSFTEALVKSFKLSFSKAENLKRTAASSKYARQIFQAMRPVFADLVQELSRSIGFYTSTHRDAKLTTLLCLGNAFHLPGLQKYLEQNLQMDVKIPSSFKMAVSSPVTEGEAFKEQMLSLISSYGLAVQGLGLGKLVSNLLPTEMARQVVWKKKRPYFAAAAACLMLTGITVWGRYWTDMGTLESGKGESVTNMSLAQAEEYEKGRQVNGPPLQVGETWLKVSQTFQSGFKDLQGKGDEQQKQVEEIIGLHKNKALWPRIVEVIHGGLPSAAPLEGGPSDTAALMAELKKVERRERKSVTLHNFSAQYLPDVDAEPLKALCEDTSKYDVPKEGTQPRPGFLVIVNFTSPFKDNIDYICKEVVPTLREAGRANGMGFYINRVVMEDAKVLGASGQVDTERTISSEALEGGKGGGKGGKGSGGGRPGAPPAGGGGKGGGGRGGSPPGDTGRGRGGGGPPQRGDNGETGGPDTAIVWTVPPIDSSLDGLTEEPIKDDFQFRIVLDVVLGDLPQKPAAAGAIEETKKS